MSFWFNYASPWLVYLYGTIFFLFLLCFLFVVFISVYNRYTCKRCTCTTSLRGQTVLITGASSGIGREAAKNFASRGAKVILACRNKEKAETVAGEIRNMTTNPNVFVKILDTSSLSSVRSFAKEILKEEEKLDVLVLNAGIGGFKEKEVTKDGLEVLMATNHFGHFLLVNLLLGLMQKSKPSRIVVTSSQLHATIRKFDPKNINFDLGPYRSNNAYAVSKLCNVLMTRYLAVYFQGKGVTVNCFCPGFVDTEFFDKSNSIKFGTFYKWLVPVAARTSSDGAQTLIHLAVSKETEEVSGAFFVDCKARKSSHLADDAGLIKKVWEKSEDLVKLTTEELTFRNKY